MSRNQVAVVVDYRHPIVASFNGPVRAGSRQRERDLNSDVAAIPHEVPGEDETVMDRT
jgi:hypothetical protein